MGKILYISLAVLLMMGTMPVCGQNASEPKLVDGYYQIENAEQLMWFRDQVNRSTEVDTDLDFTISRLNARLMADIDLSGTESWVPIGNYNTGINNHEYAGTFDGQGHVISGLTVEEIPGRISYGLFGYVWKGTVKNLGIVNSTIEGTEYVGSICGMLGNGTIDNCFSSASVMASADGASVGGLSGGLRKTSVIENSYNAGPVTATGGKDGYTDASGSYGPVAPSVGGIAGYIGSESIVMKNCFNAGQISASFDKAKVGGITGDDYSGNSTYAMNATDNEEGSISDSYYLEGTGTGKQAKALSASDFVTTINSQLFAGENDYWQGTASLANGLLSIPTFESGKPVQVSVSSGDPTAIAKTTDDVNRIRTLNGCICIDVSAPMNMRIVNITGRTVRTSRLSVGSNEIAGLPAGIYIVILDNGTRSKVVIR